MKKVKEIIGCFVPIPCCTECDWFSQPPLLERFYMPRTVCPDCGTETAETVGRYKIRETNSFFGGREREFFGFIRKGDNSEPDVPKPVGPLNEIIKNKPLWQRALGFG